MAKIILKLKRGTLGGQGFFHKPPRTRQRHEIILANKLGEKHVLGKLQAIQVLNKNRNPVVSHKASVDAKKVVSYFQKKKSKDYQPMREYY